MGANATVVCGVTLGRYAFIAAGAVVTKDIPDYGFVVGAPARLRGYMSRHGHKLIFDKENRAVCPESGLRYDRVGESVHCPDLDEEEPLPETLATGQRGYQAIKKENS